jgi:linoleate 10R-lipoxygenase
MGMRITRTDWNCASLNEFREFLGLTKLKSFKEWNSDPLVAENARRLYKDVDNLELMPGLACEEAKPSMEGSGLCPGYTISRAILSDATALVRGDRYVRLSFSLFFSLPVADLSLFFQLTTDYNAGNLTSFQWKDVQPDLENGASGGSIGKVRPLSIFASFLLSSHADYYLPFAAPRASLPVSLHLQLDRSSSFSLPSSPM